MSNVHYFQKFKMTCELESARPKKGWAENWQTKYKPVNSSDKSWKEKVDNLGIRIGHVFAHFYEGNSSFVDFSEHKFSVFHHCNLKFRDDSGMLENHKFCKFLKCPKFMRDNNPFFIQNVVNENITFFKLDVSSFLSFSVKEEAKRFFVLYILQHRVFGDLSGCYHLIYPLFNF